MLTIGEFSRLCFVTKKTLRHYDEIGLLRPEHVASNGYRYYTAAQLRTMLLISRLKSYGFALPEIAAVLANPAPDVLAGRLAQKRAQMDARLQNAQRTLRQLDEDMDKLKRSIDIMEQNIVVKTTELAPVPLYGVRKAISVAHFQEMFGRLYKELEDKGITPAGPPMAFYHDEDFNAEHSDIEVAVPVSPDKATRTLSGGPACFATLVGPYNPEAFTATYAALMSWVEDNGHRLSGSPFDKYVAGGDGVDPKDYVTEIYFPIEK